MTKKNEKTVAGFFTPELMRRLTPVAELLSESTVAGVLCKPMEAIAIMNGKFAEFADGYRGNTAMGYDPHETLLSILSLENPLLPVGSMLTAMAAARPTNDEVFARKEAVTHLCAQAALRRGTIAATQAASLVRSNGKFILRIEGGLFKNRNAQRFANGKVFEKELTDYCGCHEALDRYVDFGRKAVGMSHHRALFVTAGGAMSEGQVYNDVFDMTARFLSEDGLEGICMPGVAAFGPGGFRHILATHFLKQSRDLLVAAEAIHDDPKTVFEHYARYAPEDLRKQLKRQWRALSHTFRDRALMSAGFKLQDVRTVGVVFPYLLTCIPKGCRDERDILVGGTATAAVRSIDRSEAVAAFRLG